MRDLFKNFRKSEDGATLAEYGIALIVGIALGGSALIALSNDISGQMDDVSGIFNSDGNGSGTS